MINRFIDFEVTPNWWECSFGDYVDGEDYSEDIKANFVTITSDMPNCRTLLLDKFKEPGYVIIGWNIKNYDLIIANAIYQGFTPLQVKMISDMIIVPDRSNWTSEHWRLNPFTKKKLTGVVYQDLMDDDDGALKEKEAVIGIDIEEYDGDFNNPNMTEQEKHDMTIYNLHDIWAMIYYYVIIRKDYIDTKLSIGKTFNVPVAEVYRNTNAGLTGIALGAQYKKFNDELLDRIKLPDEVRQYVYDNVPTNIVNQVMNAPYIIDPKTGSIKYTQIKTVLFENFITFGSGGMHSVISPTDNYSREQFINNPKFSYSYPTYTESCDEWVLMNIDGASFYPSLMIFQGTLSRTIQDPQYFRELFERRIALKWKPDKTQEEIIELASLKLALNTVFGASGCKWLALYDKYQCTATCRIGQMLLTSLTCKLYKSVPGLKVIQTNTDGILVYFRRKDLPLVEKIGHEWSELTHMQLEYEEIVKTWQRDVNNYIIVKAEKDKQGNNKIKNIGEWLKDDYHKWGYGTVGTLSFFACAKAAIQYLLHGTDLVNTLVANKDLSDFCMYPKKGPSFREVIHRMTDGTEINLNRCNRIYASKDKSYGKLYKVKYRLGVKSYNAMPSSPDNCKTLNKALYSYDFKTIQKDIDYMWYIEYAADLLEINWVGIGKAANERDLSKFKY